MSTASQETRILRYMAQGFSITPLQALRKFGCLCLSQRCGDLREKGWPIDSEFVKGRKFKRYWLPKARRP